MRQGLELQLCKLLTFFHKFFAALYPILTQEYYYLKIAQISLNLFRITNLNKSIIKLTKSMRILQTSFFDFCIFFQFKFTQFPINIGNLKVQTT